jgi:hypothetical protein
VDSSRLDNGPDYDRTAASDKGSDDAPRHHYLNVQASKYALGHDWYAEQLGRRTLSESI